MTQLDMLTTIHLIRHKRTGMRTLLNQCILRLHTKFIDVRKQARAFKPEEKVHKQENSGDMRRRDGEGDFWGKVLTWPHSGTGVPVDAGAVLVEEPVPVVEVDSGVGTTGVSVGVSVNEDPSQGEPVNKMLSASWA